MQEVIAVMNGVEFKTRHNDYKLKTPVKTLNSFHETTDIPFPDVPPEVLNIDNVTVRSFVASLVSVISEDHSGQNS